jgi:hypothetical protein
VIIAKNVENVTRKLTDRTIAGILIKLPDISTLCIGSSGKNASELVATGIY